MPNSVILSTYNAPDWLALTLCGYLNQTDKDFEMVIADDGSGEETRELIERFCSHYAARKYLNLCR